MELNRCIEAARREGANVPLFIVKAPIEEADSMESAESGLPGSENDGPYGYCPLEGLPILYRFGEVVKVVHPDGMVLDYTINPLARLAMEQVIDEWRAAGRPA